MTGEQPPAVLDAAEHGPVTESERIPSLDLIRGVAVLGILVMNAVHFRYGAVPYRNISAAGTDTGLDWAASILGEILVDQRFMGLFSLLFGAGIFLFIERAARREKRPTLLNAWRNILLLIMGLIHMAVWEGDVLTTYAVSAFVLLLVRRLPARVMVAVGFLIFLSSVIPSLLLQRWVNSTDVSLAGIWVLSEDGAIPSGEDYEILSGALAFGYLMRALGLILAGAGLYRTGFMQGVLSDRFYRRMVLGGLGVGLSLSTFGVVLTHLGDFGRDVSFIGEVPNTFGTIPASLGYMSLIILWQRASGFAWLKERFIAVGRMALTNYLAHTALGVPILSYLLADVETGRAGVLLFVLAVWVLQLWWSPAWLSRFRFGPMEWLWRTGTYRRRQPLRR